MATAMDLDRMVQVDCLAGCGHRVYSDRGPVRCPCCWPVGLAADVFRRLGYVDDTVP